jgi:hypothetical protein
VGADSVPVARLDRAARPFACLRLSRTPPPRWFPNFYRAFSARIAQSPPQSARADGHLIQLAHLPTAACPVRRRLGGRLIVFSSPPENSKIFQPGYFFGLPFRAADFTPTDCNLPSDVGRSLQRLPKACSALLQVVGTATSAVRLSKGTGRVASEFPVRNASTHQGLQFQGRALNPPADDDRGDAGVPTLECDSMGLEPRNEARRPAVSRVTGIGQCGILAAS